MCGIAGILGGDPREYRERLERMIEAIRHRGPDDAAFHLDERCGLGHARLSIIDLTTAGRQPMANETDDLFLVANGEIYNFVSLRAELEALGHRFRSRSDSEVILHAYEAWGDACLDRFNGMIAFALWDAKQRRLFAAVDRFGKKPFYWTTTPDGLAFASELKALLTDSSLPREIDREAIDAYLTYRFVPAPRTIFSAVRKLPPAFALSSQDGVTRTWRYWRPASTDGAAPCRQEEFEALFEDAVDLRLASDVPLGVYLSGGVDSSLVAAVMKRRNPAVACSYGVSFDYAHDEGEKAARVGRHLGFEHRTVRVTSKDFEDVGMIVRHLDEPFGDLLAFPAFALARAAKRELTVVLTGDGADEIYHGYFHQKVMLWREGLRFAVNLPGSGRVASRLAALAPLSLWERLFDYPDRLGDHGRRKLLAALERIGSFEEFYLALTSCFTEDEKQSLVRPEFLSGRSGIVLDEVAATWRETSGSDFQARLSLLDLALWIPFSVVNRLDKLNMASAVEARSPFLDYRLVEQALAMPLSMKRAGGRNKLVLRNFLAKLLPKELIDPGKQAFYAPLTGETRASFERLVEAHLSAEAVARRGWFAPEFVAGLRAFRFGNMLANRQLTALLMLELWATEHLDGASGRA